MRNKYDLELEKLNLELIRMGAYAEEIIVDAIDVLSTKDMEKAEKIVSSDDIADGLARQIESRSMKLIMRQQPVAGDLRQISTALKMITDIERICDQCADIAEISIHLCKNDAPKPPDYIIKMGKTVANMMQLAIDAYVKKDTALAKNVIDKDDDVDRLFNMVKHELIQNIIEDKTHIDSYIDYLMVAKYLERIGDHAQNIGEWTTFAITGVHKEQRIL